ncbi:gelsolin-related protein of 125 kDa [Drosophila tropicalis]|uniref:gelsolin-related protein of 125 kDa n=1 Tax=Drosophila tropicalis TaxID=46794 RepID=UPI0035ABBCB1
MARKRKIPVRKHHGIRDPLKQQEQREKKLANVINNPPEKTDEQRVSFRFKQFQKLTEASKKGNKVKLGTIGKEDKPKSSTGASPTNSKTNAIKNIRQLAEETDEDYLRRVNRITNASVREAQYEAKYGVNVLRNPKTGEITVQKRPKNEIDELMKQKQQERRLQKNGKNRKKLEKPSMDEKTRKELVKQAIREVKQEQRNGIKDPDEVSHPAEYKRDVFTFGETVHAPPTLKTLPRKAAKNETVPRPGRKGNLLLSSMLDGTNRQIQANEERVKPTAISKIQHKTPTKVQMKGKRKDLPAATRSMLETEQQKMIELYRQLKSNSTTNKSSD